jgi:DNA-binding MarR family transcriptional regulator
LFRVSLIRQEATAERERRGWTESQYVAMSVLGWNDDCRLADIAAFAQTRRLTLTPAAVEPLVGAGLIDVALPVEMSSQLVLTPSGREAAMAMFALLKSGEAAATEALDPSEIQMAKQLLRRVGTA